MTEPCPECGFDPSSVGPADASAAARGFGRRYRAPLTRLLPDETDEVLRRRDGDTWSALEYAAHVRDVFGLFDRRVAVILASERPDLEVVDHDAVVASGAYDGLDPTAVADELAAAAEALAATLESVPEDGWDRVGYREGEERTVLDIARRAVHEGNHHLLDVGRALRHARGR